MVSITRSLSTFGRLLVAPRAGRDVRWIVGACILVMVTLALSVVAGGHQRHSLTFDASDEQAHYDYVLSLRAGHIPRTGDHYSQNTLRMISCLGVEGALEHGCGVARRNPLLDPPAGYSYEATEQPPLGYLPYVLTANPSAPPSTALADARRGGLIWAVVGAALVAWVGWLGELSLAELGALLVLCLLNPYAVRAEATVTNDAAGVAAGAATVVIYLIAKRRHSTMIVVGLIVGLVVGLTKGIFIIAPAILVIGSLVGEWLEGLRPNRMEFWRRQACSLAMFVGAAMSYVGWTIFQDGRERVPAIVVFNALYAGLPKSNPLPSLTSILGSINEGFQPFTSLSGAPLYALWNLAIIGSLIGILVLKGPPAGSTRLRAMVFAVLLGFVLVTAGAEVLSWSQGHYIVSIGARYGIPMLPILGLVLVRSLRPRGLLLIGLLLPGAALIAQLVQGQF